MSFHATLGNDGNRLTHELSKILEQPSQVEQASAAPHVNQKVNIAPLVGFTAGH